MKTLRIIILIVLFSLGVYYVYTYLPVNVDWNRGGPPSVGVDWKGAFQPAARSLLSLRSPYENPAYFNPPWALLPLLPIALLPAGLGVSILFMMNIYSYLFVASKLRMNAVAFVFFLIFSRMLVNSWNGNIEGLLALGFILPPQIGMLFVLVKPQYGIGVAIFWVAQAWVEGGIRKVARVVLPAGIAFALSFALFGFWPAGAPDLTGVWWNTSMFPYGVPIGFILVGVSIWAKDIRFAIASSPFFAPYLTGHTWSVVWFGLLLLVPENLAIFREMRKNVNIQQT